MHRAIRPSKAIYLGGGTVFSRGCPSPSILSTSLCTVQCTSSRWTTLKGQISISIMSIYRVILFCFLAYILFVIFTTVITVIYQIVAEIVTILCLHDKQNRNGRLLYKIIMKRRIRNVVNKFYIKVLYVQEVLIHFT